MLVRINARSIRPYVIKTVNTFHDFLEEPARNLIAVRRRRNTKNQTPALWYVGFNICYLSQDNFKMIRFQCKPLILPSMRRDKTNIIPS